MNASIAGRRFGAFSPTHGAAAALAALVVLNLAFTPGFASVATFWTTLVQLSTTILVAVGMTLVIATGGIDLSVGSVMAIASVASAVSLERGAAFATLAGLASGVLVGAMNGLLVTKAEIQPFIVTLAVFIGGRGVAQVVSHEGELIPFDDPTFERLGKGSLGPVPVQVALMVLVVVVALVVVRESTFGRYLVATGGNERAARLSGIAVFRVKMAVYLSSGLLAALAGVIETARLGTTDSANMGRAMELDAIAAVVIGGTPFRGGKASIVGTILGALLLGVVNTSFNMHLVPFAWSLVVKAGIIVLAVYVQRQAT